MSARQKREHRHEEHHRLGHVAIRVKDVRSTLDFYVGKLGFDEMFRLERDGRAVDRVPAHHGQPVSRGVSRRPSATAAPARGTGLNHVCLEVDDIDAVLRLVSKEQGHCADAGQKELGADGNLQAWTEDPDGNRIELIRWCPPRCR